MSEGTEGTIAAWRTVVRARRRGEVFGVSTTFRHEVTLLVRQDCPACDTAEAEIDRVCSEVGVAWSVSDVDADTELRAEYGDRVPVILVDGVEHGFWKVEPQRLRAALLA